VDGLGELLSPQEGGAADFGAWLFSSNLALTTLGIAAWLHQAGGWRVLPTAVRRVLVDYDVTFAVVATTALSFAWQAAAPPVERIGLPPTLSPTCHYGSAAPGGAGAMAGHFRADCVGGAQAGEQRPWLVSFQGAGLTLWLVAFASAVPIAFFFYMDQVRLG
jgi:hypothetical protein